MYAYEASFHRVRDSIKYDVLISYREERAVFREHFLAAVLLPVEQYKGVKYLIFSHMHSFQRCSIQEFQESPSYVVNMHHFRVQ